MCFSSRVILFCFFSFLLTVFSCKKEDHEPNTKSSNNSNSDNITSEYYFKATINDSDVVFQYNVDNFGCANYLGGESCNLGYQQNNGSLMMNYITFQSSGFLILKTFENDYSITDSMLESMISVNSYMYGQEAKHDSSCGENGAIVTYTDNNLNTWQSDWGVGNQDGSYFKIVEHGESVIVNSQKFAITKAQFSCNLYDSLGNSVKLTNGEVRGLTFQAQ